MTYKTLETNHTPVLSWAGHELGTDEARMAQNMSSLPFIFKHISLMPDVHLGKGALVGSVIATKDTIIPAAVGVDIGCGMSALKTNLKAEQLEGLLPRIRSEIEAAIPVGAGENREVKNHVDAWKGWKAFDKLHTGVQDEITKARRQIGSLGGGNHFIEICLDTADNVWLMLHSGSRGIGNKLASRHIENAKQLARLTDLKLRDPDLAYFISGTSEFAEYWHDLQWAQEYARFNRDVMMKRLVAVIQKNVGEIKTEILINCHHNYAEREVHYGEEVIVTRKGAVKAGKDDYGIIPGSMGSKSYIVKGKGNLESFCSCSHGAGRRMSRTKAKNIFTLEDFAQQTAGVECRKDTGVIDEIPGAYKDIDEVMANQADLVEVVATIKQILCVKG